MGIAARTHSADELRDRSIRLFKFLFEVEKFRSKRIHNLAAYASTTPPGAVVWIGDLPDEPEVKTVLNGRLEPDSDTLVQLSRTVLPVAPDLPGELAGRVANTDSSDPSDPPALRPDPETGEPSPQAQEAFDTWLVAWHAWAEEVTRLRPVRDLYRRMFRLYEQIDQTPEDLEAVVAAGCLSWQPDGHAAVQRHLTTMAVELAFDAESGVIAVQVPPARSGELELDMLDPKRHPRPAIIEQTEEALTELDTTVVDEAAIGPLLKTITHGLSDEAAYDAEACRPGPVTRRAQVAFAPAFVVRKPSNERKMRVLAAIIAALEDEEQDVPDGVSSIVAAIDLDVDEAQLDPDTDLEDAESYLPLAANRAQQEIVWSVEHRRHTVVQGPPGTGKTHTIANVLSHLLATGRRVLISAHTERALKEVRGKLPPELQDLVIAVTGQGRDEKAALERSVREMTAYVDQYQPARAHRHIAELEDGLDELRRRQAYVRTDMVEARSKEVEKTSIGHYRGTLAEIAQQLADEAETYSWLEDTGVDADAPLDGDQCRQLLELLRLEEFDTEADALDQPLPDLDALPEPDEFATLVSDVARAARAATDAERHQDHDSHASLDALDADTRQRIATELRAVADDVRVLQERPETWVGRLLADLAAGRPGTWERRAADLEEQLATCDELITDVTHRAVRVPDDADLDRLLAQARGLAAHLNDGGKVGKLIKSRPVRDASELLDGVLVDGAVPDVIERVDKFITWARLSQALDHADDLWPSSVDIPDEDTFNERLAWHHTELGVLVDTLTVGKRLSDLHQELTTARISHPAWLDTDDVLELAAVAAEPELRHNHVAASAPLDALEDTLSSGRTGSLREQMRRAAADRDVASYAAAWSRISELRDLRERRTVRDRLVGKFEAALPDTARVLIPDPYGDWDERLEQLDAACAWAQARNELRRILDDDRTDALLVELDRVTRDLQRQVLNLTVARSWSYAVDRLDPLQRKRLNTYALLAKKLPKGGKYRARKLREVQEALRLCRDAVPAWIMPINYVADVLDVDPDAFDVVIVDEASQAGMDATFLQYLGPKVIVIGDDLQVSPTSFVDLSELHRLADDLLYDFEDKPLWADPGTSLFDHANNRFGKRITLVEHFRCMPEIIGFSQRFIYERNGVNLIPLRQYGVDRLTPVKTLHVRDGYRTGKTNPPEIDAIVELIAKCDVDPAYEIRDRDGRVRKRTFGVISLTGSDQAKLIEAQLLERLGERAYTERDIRCGDAADFQGSQREVIFLSMVDAMPPDGSRISKRGDVGTDQRINVAASRAQDQMWLIHSVLPTQLHPEDIRHHLLTYCIATERQFGTSTHAVPQRADDRILDAERFDSLFEQRVFNRIVDRGYAVRPQFDVNGYRIDLVVIGSETKLAVECDGDEWHGPDRYANDIARQRDLERAEWTFFRIRESEFYADRDGSLEPLWALLDSHGIYPLGTEPAGEPTNEDAGVVTGAPHDDVTRSPATAEPQPFEPSSEPVQPDMLSDGAPTEQVSLWDSRARSTADGRDDTTAEALGGGDLPPAVPAESETDEADEPEADKVAVEDDTVDVVEAEVGGSSVEPGSGPLVGPNGVPTAPNTPPAAELVDELAAVYANPAPHEAWDTTTTLVDPVNARPTSRNDAILRIIAAEGPVLGDRLYHQYVRSSGGTRVGSAVRKVLNRTTHQLEADGEIIGEDPLDEGGQVAKTFRLPDQPTFLVRELGDRTIHDIPPLELAARIHALRRPHESGGDTFRRVLKRYGLSNLTAKTRKRLEACNELARDRFE